MNLAEFTRRRRAVPTQAAVAAVAAMAGALGLPPAQAQAPVQVVKPPVSQAWIDVATFSGMGMPGMGAAGAMGGAAPSPMQMLGGLLGGRGGSSGAQDGGNRFGQTQTMSTGRWVDVTLMTRQNPQLADAQQNVPPGFLSPALKLQSPKETKGTPPEPGDDRVTEPEYEKPRGKILMYWGCGDAIRSGQPRVLDMATASIADLGRFFQSRSATQRGTHSAVGRPVWPSPPDTRMVPQQASLVGEHAFSGAGVPEGFRFQWPAAQDLMPAIALSQRDAGGATQLEWQALPTARAYFVAAMGAGGKEEMVLWTSAEQPDTGFGLMDYQTNPAVDRWLREQILLAPQTTRCTVPKGIFTGQGAMLKMIAYGSELNLAHPPRPTDPRIAWEPQWAVKVRVKSVMQGMLGMDMPQGMQGIERPAPPAAPTPQEPQKPNVKDLLRGVLGR